MADGQVLIDSKLNTEGVGKGIENLKKDFTRLSRELSKLAEKIEREFNDVDLGDVGKELSESMERGAEDAQEAMEETADSAEKAADEMADAMEDAAEHIASESDEAADDVKEDFDDIGDKAKKTGEEVKDSFSGVFKDVFGANVLSNVVSNAFEQLGEFAMDAAKDSIQAAADVQASNAQFEQTFKDVESTARKSLNSIAKQTGVTASRMQDSYTKIYAFTKSIGGSSSQALDIASRAMIAAADSAAYYDRSLEETTETLQSFLKGNYENDAALGIAATETTRNTMANKLYAKSFIELSESQKVDVLLAMVEAGNEASGALGQAAREADSWTNVMGELQEAWKQFLAVLGDPVLRTLTPMIQGITAGLQEMSQVAASTELADGMNEFKNSIAGIDEEFNAATESIEKSAIMAELCKDTLARLAKEGFEEDSAASREYANAVEQLNSIYPELNLQIDAQTGLLDANSQAMLGNLEAMKKRALFAAQEEKLNAALNAQAKAKSDLISAEKALDRIQRERDAIVQQLTQQTGLESDALISLYANQTNAAAGYTDMSNAAIVLTEEQMKLVQQILELNAEESRLTSGLDEGNIALAEQEAILEEAKATYDETAKAMGLVTDAQDEAAASAGETTEAEKELIQAFEEAATAARESFDSQIGYFDEISTKSDKSAQQIIDNWGKQTTAYENYAVNLQKAIDMKLDDKLIQQFSDGSEESMLYLDQLVNHSGKSVGEINAEFQKLDQARDKPAEIAGAWKEGMEVVTEEVTTAVDGMLTETEAGAEESVANSSDKMVTLVKPATDAINTMKTDTKAALTEMEGYFTESFGRMVGTVQQAVTDMDIDALNDKVKKLREEVSTIPGEVDTTVSQMVTDANTAATTAMSEAGGTITSTVLDPLQEDATTTGNIIAEAFETAAKSMKTAWTGMGNWFDTNVVTPIKTGMESLAQTYASVNSEMVANTATAWAQMVETVNQSIDAMQNKINSLEGRTVNVGISGSGTSDASYIAEDQTPAYTPAAAALEVPYLARGAVIPPRAPFLAMLGDQTSGTNIEAPLDTIKQAVSEVLGEGFDITTTVNFEGTLAELIRLLYPEIRSEAKRRGTNLAQEVIA